jgi:hypothetical protein
MPTGFESGNPKEKDKVEDLSKYGTIILKQILKERIGGCGLHGWIL